MWGYRKKLTDEEIAEFIIEYIEYNDSFRDFIMKMKEKELSKETVLKIIEKMGPFYRGYEYDFKYFYIDEEYNDSYVDFEDKKIYWWFPKPIKLEDKEKQSIINKMVKRHPCEYSIFDFLRIVQEVKPTIEDTLSILERLEKIGYVTIRGDFYNLFYDEDSFLKLLVFQNKSSPQQKGFFGSLFSNENNRTKNRDYENDYDSEDEVYDMSDDTDYTLAYDEYDEEDLDDIE